MSKKIFVVTGEPSGDRLAYKVISRLKKDNIDIEFLSVGGTHIKSLGIKSIFDLKEITYLGFTSVIFNLFRIKKKIDFTVNKILEFKPDILFTIDSPDFTLRVAKLVKRKKPSIKTIHYVAPQVWVWRRGRVKSIKNFIDHILLLFRFEKKFFDKENVKSTFVGHPIFDKDDKSKIDISSLIDNKKKIISIFPGSRLSEINTLIPILKKFILLMNKKYSNFIYIFHSTDEHKNTIRHFLNKSKISNFDIVSEENIKKNILSKSFFAIAKSGTISLEICNAKVPSIIIYKMNFINFFIIKLLVKVRFANIINIINDQEVIPELLQSDCNPFSIFKKLESFINNPDLGTAQVLNYEKTLNNMKLEESSSEAVSNILKNSIN